MWEGENHLIPPNHFIFPNMSCIQNELILESIFEEVQEAFPFYSEEKQIEIANNRFQELAQWIIIDKTKFSNSMRKETLTSLI